jgi:hypothetical protein
MMKFLTVLRSSMIATLLCLSAPRATMQDQQRQHADPPASNGEILEESARN